MCAPPEIEGHGLQEALMLSEPPGIRSRCPEWPSALRVPAWGLLPPPELLEREGIHRVPGSADQKRPSGVGNQVIGHFGKRAQAARLPPGRLVPLQPDPCDSALEC